MRKLSGILSVVLFGLAALVPLAAHAYDTVSLPWNQWQAHFADDPACATDGPSCPWQEAQGRLSMRTSVGVAYIWARREINLPPELAQAPSLALLVQGIFPVYDVYANGRLIGSSGDLRTRSGPLDARHTFVIPRSSYPDGRLVLTLHLQNMRVTNPEGRMEPFLGLPPAVQRQRDLDTYAFLYSEWQHYICYLLVFFVSLFFLLLFSIDRTAPEYLWLALLLIGLSGLRFLEFASIVDLGFETRFAQSADVVLNAVSGVSLVEFSFAFLRRRVPWYFRIVQASACFFPVAYEVFFLDTAYHPGASAGHFWRFIIDFVDRPSLLLASLSWLLLLPRCFRSRQPEMRWIGGSLAFLVFEEANRHLTLGALPGLLQNIQLGAVNFDIRALAYFLFACVMLVAMTFRFRRIQERNRKVEQEMAAAAAVQSLLLSSRSAAVGSFAIESIYHPAGEVGGDFFHVAPAVDGGVLVIVGDVSGKGLKAAMTVATIIGALRDFPALAPSSVLAHLNRVLYGQVDGFVTCCVAHLQPDGTLVLANAGHIPPYCNGQELDCAPGLPLGILERQEWTDFRLQLEPGARLVFVSDGVVEAATSSGELFGFERTRAISGNSAEIIAAAARDFTAGSPQADDITVLGVQFQPVPVPAN